MYENLKSFFKIVFLSILETVNQELCVTMSLEYVHHDVRRTGMEPCVMVKHSHTYAWMKCEE